MGSKNNAEYTRRSGDLQGYLHFRQLAEWLEELKAIKKKEWSFCPNCGADMRGKEE